MSLHWRSMYTQTCGWISSSAPCTSYPAGMISPFWITARWMLPHCFMKICRKLPGLPAPIPTMCWGISPTPSGGSGGAPGACPLPGGTGGDLPDRHCQGQGHRDQHLRSAAGIRGCIPQSGMSEAVPGSGGRDPHHRFRRPFQSGSGKGHCPGAGHCPGSRIYEYFLF